MLFTKGLSFLSNWGSPFSLPILLLLLLKVTQRRIVGGSCSHWSPPLPLCIPLPTHFSPTLSSIYYPLQLEKLEEITLLLYYLYQVY